MLSRLVVVDAGFHTDGPFSHLFREIVTYTGPSQLRSHDTLILEGGTDISPTIYGETPNPRTQSSDRGRDAREQQAFEAAQKIGASVIGICRGAQLITALTGGKLVQHVENHHGWHEIYLAAGGVVNSNSIHHQMMRPNPKVPHKLLGWTLSRSGVYLNGSNVDIANSLPHLDGAVVEPEIVWYPTFRSLCIQGHPEFLGKTHPFVKLCGQMVSNLLKGDSNA